MLLNHQDFLTLTNVMNYYANKSTHEFTYMQEPTYTEIREGRNYIHSQKEFLHVRLVLMHTVSRINSIISVCFFVILSRYFEGSYTAAIFPFFEWLLKMVAPLLDISYTL